MPKTLYKSKNPHNQFILDKIVEMKNRSLMLAKKNAAFVYQKIIASLQQFPMPLLCEEQVNMLDGVGEKTSSLIMTLIQSKYQQYQQQFYDQINLIQTNKEIIQENIEENEEELDQIKSDSCPPNLLFQGSQLQKRKEIQEGSFIEQLRKQAIKNLQPIVESKSKKQFKPGKNSKSGQVLMCLYGFQKNENRLFASKQEIKKEYRQLCNQEIQNWSMIDTLEKNELVQKTILGPDIKYALTEEGKKIGQQYYIEKQIQHQQEKEQIDQNEKIILLIDNRERFQSTNRQLIYDKMNNIYQIECRLTTLPIGDFMWICQKGEDEFVLNYIVERKTISDLASSIIDKRYQGQKNRLKHCGISNLFYLIENCQANNLSVPRSTIDKAIRNTQIKDGFFIQQTENLEDSLRWLALFTKTVKLNKNPMKYQEFIRQNSAKNESLFNLWGSMLRGIHGVGLETAKAIACNWKTPADFINILRQNQEKGLSQLINESDEKLRSIPSSLLIQIEILFSQQQYPN